MGVFKDLYMNYIDLIYEEYKESFEELKVKFI